MSDVLFQKVDADKLTLPFKNVEDMTGVEKIQHERVEQKIKHNHSIKSDWEQYPDFELCRLAEAVLQGGIDDYFPSNMDSSKWEKVMKKSYEERLVIAGALIAAEIDRLNFTE